MKAQIENLKTELREFIELSKQVSPSKWTVSYGSHWIENAAKVWLDGHNISDQATASTK